MTYAERAEELRTRLAHAGVTRSIEQITAAIETEADNWRLQFGYVPNFDGPRAWSAVEDAIVEHLGLPELILDPTYLEWRTKLFILEEVDATAHPEFDNLITLGLKHGWLDDEGMLAA